MRDVPVTWQELKNLLGPTDQDGTHSFEDLSRAASSLGLHPVPLEADRHALPGLPTPFIAQVQPKSEGDGPPHFILVLRAEADRVILVDPPRVPRPVGSAYFARTWTGHVLVFAADEKQAQSLKIRGHVQQGFSVVFWAWLVLGGIVLGSLATIRPAQVIVSWWARISRRTRWTALAGVSGACLVILFVPWLLSRLPRGAPCCSLDKSSIDLGELQHGRHTAEIWVKNQGGSPLHITKVQSSCSCAGVAFPPVIEPQASAAIRVSLEAQPGPRQARLRVVSDDPEGPKDLLVTWHGKLVPWLVPPFIEGPPVLNGNRYERTVTVIYPKVNSGLRPQLKGVECDSDVIHVREVEDRPSGGTSRDGRTPAEQTGQLTLHVSVDAPAQADWVRTRCKLLVQYGNSADDTLELPISVAFRHDPFGLDTGRLVFTAGRLEQLTGKERVVSLTAPFGSGLVVRNVPDWLRSDILSPPECRLAIRFTVIKPPPGRLLSHTVQVQAVNDPSISYPLPIHVFAPEG
jgi:hypothetical protein